MTEPLNKNGVSIAKILENLNWPTVVLILFTGGTNLFATHENGSQLQYQRDTVFRQVSDLHRALDEFEKRQKLVLENQTAMMNNDSRILAETHDIVLKFEKWKRLEQMRGAPP